MSGYFALASGAGGVAGLGVVALAAHTTSRAGLAITSCVLALYFAVLLTLILRGFLARLNRRRRPAIVSTRPIPRHLAGAATQTTSRHLTDAGEAGAAWRAPERGHVDQ